MTRHVYVALEQVRTSAGGPPATRSQRRRLATLLPVLFVCALAVTRLGSLAFTPLLDPSAARYAEIGCEMLKSGDWITPRFDADRPFWGKPPLQIWSVALSYRIFGQTAAAARVPSFVAWLVMLAATWVLTRRWFSKTNAWWAAAVLGSSALPWFISNNLRYRRGVLGVSGRVLHLPRSGD